MSGVPEVPRYGTHRTILNVSQVQGADLRQVQKAEGMNSGDIEALATWITTANKAMIFATKVAGGNWKVDSSGFKAESERLEVALWILARTIKENRRVPPDPEGIEL
jgi:hypothetical protein